MTKIVTQSMDGWYFAEPDRKLRYGDRRAIVIGKTHRVRGELILCEHGLHASARALDALGYAPGPIVYRVKLHGQILQGDDKACATARTYVAGGIDVSDELRAFARWCGLQVAHLWDMPSIVRQYLETGDESIRAAARDAAWDAARDAARAAAWDAARAAARAAAWDAARAAAWDAFINTANIELERRLTTAIDAAPAGRLL
jgi:hypothetical protein